MNDPLYGIPDTNMPHLADIRLARSLQGSRGWRRKVAVVWLAALVVGAVLGSFTWILR